MLDFMKPIIGLFSIPVVLALVFWFKEPPPSKAHKKASASPVAKTSLSAEKVLAKPSANAKSTPKHAQTLTERSQAIFDLKNPLERKQAFDKLLSELTTLSDFQGLIETFESLKKEGRRFDREWAHLWLSLGHRDPALAVQLLQGYGPNKEWYFESIAHVMESWGTQSPEEAMNWLQKNEALTGNQLDSALSRLVQGYASRDLKAATNYALSVVQPGEPLFKVIANSLSAAASQQGGTQGLLSWFDDLPSDAHKQASFMAVSRRLGDIDSQKLREWLLNQSHQSYRHDDAYRAYAQRLAEQNPRTAMDFVFSEAPRLDNGSFIGLGYAAYEWLMQDPQGLSKYVESLPDAAQRRTVIEALKGPLSDVNFPMRKRNAAEQFLKNYPQP
jgi:hypothetical protein